MLMKVGGRIEMLTYEHEQPLVNQMLDRTHTEEPRLYLTPEQDVVLALLVEELRDNTLNLNNINTYIRYLPNFLRQFTSLRPKIVLKYLTTNKGFLIKCIENYLNDVPVDWGSHIKGYAEIPKGKSGLLVWTEDRVYKLALWRHEYAHKHRTLTGWQQYAVKQYTKAFGPITREAINGAAVKFLHPYPTDNLQNTYKERLGDECIRLAKKGLKTAEILKEIKVTDSAYPSRWSRKYPEFAKKWAEAKAIVRRNRCGS